MTDLERAADHVKATLRDLEPLFDPAAPDGDGLPDFTMGTGQI